MTYAEVAKRLKARALVGRITARYAVSRFVLRVTVEAFAGKGTAAPPEHTRALHPLGVS